MTFTPMTEANPGRPGSSGFHPPPVRAKPNCRTNPLQYQHGARVVTMIRSRIIPLAACIAKRIGFTVHGGIAVLHASIVAGAEEPAGRIKNRCADGDDRPLPGPFCASLSATSEYWRSNRV